MGRLAAFSWGVLTGAVLTFYLNRQAIWDWYWQEQ